MTRSELLAPDLLAYVQSYLEQMMFDKDPGVMVSAFNIVSYNTEVRPALLSLFDKDQGVMAATLDIVIRNIELRPEILALGLLLPGLSYFPLHLLALVQVDVKQMLFDKDPGVMAAALNIMSK